MLQDFVRTGTYQRAVFENAADFRDKIVLDVGAGTGTWRQCARRRGCCSRVPSRGWYACACPHTPGILSFFALQAGAKKVYAIEASAMADHLRVLADGNGCADRIVVINHKVEDIELPEMVCADAQCTQRSLVVQQCALSAMRQHQLGSAIAGTLRGCQARDRPPRCGRHAPSGAARTDRRLTVGAVVDAHAACGGPGAGTCGRPPQVDVIISEPMGTMLVNERMLESYVYARRWLREGGIMFPSIGRLYMAPFTDEFLYMELVNKAMFWQQQSFFGVNLAPLCERAMRECFSQPVRRVRAQSAHDKRPHLPGRRAKVVDCFDARLLLASPACFPIDFRTVDEVRPPAPPLD